MNHAMRQIFSSAALVFLLTGTGPVMAQETVPEDTFFQICANGTAAEIGEALKNGAKSNAKDKEGKTALMFAAEKNSPDAVQVLLKAGAEINARDEKKKTALMWAARKNLFSFRPIPLSLLWSMIRRETERAASPDAHTGSC